MNKDNNIRFTKVEAQIEENTRQAEANTNILKVQTRIDALESYSRSSSSGGHKRNDQNSVRAVATKTDHTCFSTIRNWQKPKRILAKDHSVQARFEPWGKILAKAIGIREILLQTQFAILNRIASTENWNISQYKTRQDRDHNQPWHSWKDGSMDDKKLIRKTVSSHQMDTETRWWHDCEQSHARHHCWERTRYLFEHTRLRADEQFATNAYGNHATQFRQLPLQPRLQTTTKKNKKDRAAARTETTEAKNMEEDSSEMFLDVLHKNCKMLGARWM